MTRSVVALAVLGLLSAMHAEAWSTPARHPWRGVFFNPQAQADPNFPWLLYYGDHRDKVRSALRDLRETAGIDLVDVFVLIPNSLRVYAQGNRVGETIDRWANTSFLDNVARFVDDCHAAGVDAELDLVDNRWIPYSIDSANHIGRPGDPWWPVADDTPWDESAAWHRQVIEYVEAHSAHPEAIAMWCMMGNYHWGAAEPVLWDDTGHPEIEEYTERFVKHVWPVFRSAGKRPKASPIMLPIFADNAYWRTKTPADRLGAFSNLKKWLVDDLKLAPDYWVMSTYPYCDPAPDGCCYLRKVVDILGRKNAGRIVSTDLKGIGHEDETRETILQRTGRSGADILRWQIAKCREYGFAGWWMWAYEDTPTSHTGLRRLDGTWKDDLVAAIREAGSKTGR